MNIRIRITIIIVIMMGVINYPSRSQRKVNNAPEKSRLEIEDINRRLEQLYLTENSNALISLYAEQLTFFLEYKPAIFEIKKLEAFFKNYFKVADIKAYKKKIYTVEVFGDYILEIGTFDLSYSSVRKLQGEYNGKYMKLWKRNAKGTLDIVSEAFGADRYLEPEDVPYADVEVEESNFVAKHTISQQLMAQIEQSDAIVIKAVAEGDGDTRAKGFTDDAILMSNFDSIRVGMEIIRPKMLKTYNSRSSFIVKHTYSRIYDLGDYVLINGHYKGGPSSGGRFSGNMSNLMKRDKNGTLLMYRQLGNRDSGN